jgi:hypothetical protein
VLWIHKEIDQQKVPSLSSLHHLKRPEEGEPKGCPNLSVRVLGLVLDILELNP